MSSDSFILRRIKDEGLHAPQKNGWKDLFLKYEKSLEQNLRTHFPHYRDDSILQDIVNETFLTVWSNILMDKYNDKGKLSAYICAIGRITLLNYYRAQKTHFLIHNFERFENTRVESEETIREIEKARSDAFQTLRNCFEKILNKEEKEILEAKYLDGIPFCKIADSKNVTSQALRQKVFRIRKKLRKYIKNNLSNLLPYSPSF